jgi:polar amino acid transport system substrate-binding protein
MRLLSFWIGLLILALAGAAHGQSLSLATSQTYPRSTLAGDGFQDLILKEACRRLGLSLRTDHVSSERALANANEGIDDGVYARVAGLEGQYANLVMVPEKVAEFTYLAFTANPDIAVPDWKSLCGFEVGIVTGLKILEKHLTGCPSLTKVRDPEALFDMLEHGRIEVAVIDGLEGREILNRRGSSRIRALAPALTRLDMYVYLNKARADLVPKMAQVLAVMKADGTFQSLIDTVTKRGRP